MSSGALPRMKRWRNGLLVNDAFVGLVISLSQAVDGCSGGGGEAVILERNVAPVTLRIRARLVVATVAVLQLVGACAGGLGHHLVAEADAEYRLSVITGENFLDLIHRARQDVGVAGAAADEQAVGLLFL